MSDVPDPEGSPSLDPNGSAASEPAMDLAPPGRSKAAMALVAAAVVVLIVGFVVARDSGDDSPETVTAPTDSPPTDVPPIDGTATVTAPPTQDDSGGLDAEATAPVVDPDTEPGELLPPPTAAPPDGGPQGDTRTVFELQVGDCWNDPPDFDDDEVPIEQLVVVDCDLPHDNEVFSVFDLPAGDYDADQVADSARLGCLSAFEPYVGTPHADSLLDFFALWPREQSWIFGDREVVCSLYDIERTPILGSMQGSNR